MPHPFHPDDFPINRDVELKPTRVFYLKGAVHFKTDAQIRDLTGQVRAPSDGFGGKFLDEASATARKLEQKGAPPAYGISSCGNMMRTIKTMTDAATGERLCDLNITFVSFGASAVRFPPGSAHSRHEIEMCPVDDGWSTGPGSGSSFLGGGSDARHEGFVKNSIPYFWDMPAGSGGRVATLYKCWNQQRVEIGKVAGYGFDRDAVLVLNGDELDPVVAVSTAVILLNGRDAMDA
ncbi:hypothetical protein GGR56DRAFT_618965 [Xylariaceae sp. FL0804]|nr:hypothetical protein GGR56DRAFT_618965 [Xylariaceae sp. FL0804]